MKKIAVIGGGASGLYVANLIGEHFAKTGNSPKITIFEKNNKIGKKLSATGNGRCNLSNTHVDIGKYDSVVPSKNFIESIITDANYKEAMAFFKRHGLLCFSDEEGRVYPNAQTTASVINVLTENFERYSIDLLLETKVDNIKKKNSIYELTFASQNNDKQKAYFDYVVVCAGGKASPKFGTDGNFYDVLSNMGLDITKQYPLLNGLAVDNQKQYKLLSGVRLNGCVAFYANDKLIYTENGQVQFSDKGISGIVTMNVSLKTVHHSKDKQYLKIDFLADYNEDELIKLLNDRNKSLGGASIEKLLLGIVNEKVARFVAETPSIKNAHLINEQIKLSIQLLKGMRVDIAELLGYDTAQVTGGGVNVAEIQPQTMQCKKYSGMYIIGETVDVHGMCGGYNLQWCWSSANNAAKDIINKLELEK